MRTLATLSVSLLLTFGAASAQTVWSANATTAVPNYPTTAVVKTTTVDVNAHGRGLRPRMTPEGFGISNAYIPVTAPQQSVFACISIRAEDSNTAGSIRAEFVRQPRNANPGPAVTMGTVGTNDSGFQFQSAAFGAHVINYSLYTYYIRLTFSYQGAATGAVPSPIAFDLSLSGTCG